ncbi:MAG: DUF1835 domain-containing protein [Firmicutes bacterium]|nr:DUF1835 domain-containing protein [Bacillota bacterium]
MIEIVFREEWRGSLGHAQNYGKGEYPGGYSFITYYNEDGSIMTSSEAKAAEAAAEEAERKRWEEAAPLGGNPEDVFNFDMCLNVGNIAGLNCLDERIAYIGNFPSDHPDFKSGEFERDVQQRVIEQMESVLVRLQKGEKARVWYGDRANEKCGFLWFIWNCCKSAVPEDSVSLVHLEDALGKTPGDWHKYVDMQKNLAADEKDAYCLAWEKLMEENAPLRAVKEKKVLSVQEDYYDELIMNEADSFKKAFQEGWLVGNVRDKAAELPEYFVLSRIDKLIADNHLVVTEEAGSWPRSFRKLEVI